MSILFVLGETKKKRQRYVDCTLGILLTLIPPSLPGQEPPTCIGCDERLSIKHILLACLERAIISRNIIGKEFNFLKDTNIFDKI